jgi:hypothetical protein
LRVTALRGDYSWDILNVMAAGRSEKLPAWPKNLQRAQYVEGALLFGLIILAIVNQSKPGPEIIALIAFVLSGFAYLLMGRAKRQWSNQASQKPDLRPPALALGVSTLVILTGAALYIFS